MLEKWLNRATAVTIVFAVTYILAHFAVALAKGWIPTPW